MFDSTGRWLRTFGRHGGGPGEFNELTGVVRIAPDTILAFDRRSHRLTLFSSAGVVVRSWGLPRPDAEPVGVVDRGLLLFQTIPASVPQGVEQVIRPNSVVGVAGFAEGLIDSLASFPGAERYVGPGFGMERSFGATTLIAADSGGFLAVATDRGDVRRFDGHGNLTAVYHLRLNRHIVSQAMVGAERSKLKASQPAFDPSGLPADLRRRIGTVLDAGSQAAARMPIPDSLPCFDRLLIDGARRIWLREYVSDPDAPARWLVLDKNGRFAAQVSLAPGLLVLDVSATELLSVRDDRLDVPVVERRALKWRAK